MLAYDTILNVFKFIFGADEKPLEFKEADKLEKEKVSIIKEEIEDPNDKELLRFYLDKVLEGKDIYYYIHKKRVLCLYSVDEDQQKVIIRGIYFRIVGEDVIPNSFFTIEKEKNWW